MVCLLPFQEKDGSVGCCKCLSERLAAAAEAARGGGGRGGSERRGGGRMFNNRRDSMDGTCVTRLPPSSPSPGAASASATFRGHISLQRFRRGGGGGSSRPWTPQPVIAKHNLHISVS